MTTYAFEVVDTTTSIELSGADRLHIRAAVRDYGMTPTLKLIWSLDPPAPLAEAMRPIKIAVTEQERNEILRMLRWRA